MIKVREDLTGNKYGLLTVLGQTEDYVTKNGNRRYARWLCECECGNIKSILGISLKSGNAKSCGCMHHEWVKKYNEYKIIENNTVKVYLTNCEDSFICDIDDWMVLKKYCWSKGISGYPEARVNGKNRLIHHLIIAECPDGMVRDHINRDKLDNRKENLRIVTRSENNRNKKIKNKFGYRGIYKTCSKSKKQYAFRTRNNNGDISTMFFSTLEEAIEESKRVYGDLSEAI